MKMIVWRKTVIFKDLNLILMNKNSQKIYEKILVTEKVYSISIKIEIYLNTHIWLKIKFKEIEKKRKNGKY